MRCHVAINKKKALLFLLSEFHRSKVQRAFAIVLIFVVKSITLGSTIKALDFHLFSHVYEWSSVLISKLQIQRYPNGTYNVIKMTIFYQIPEKPKKYQSRQEYQNTTITKGSL